MTLRGYDEWKTTPPDDEPPHLCEHGANRGECPVCAGDATIAECPRCGSEHLDFDGFGVVYDPACGYCRHLSRENGVCSYCGEMPAAKERAL